MKKLKALLVDDHVAFAGLLFIFFSGAIFAATLCIKHRDFSGAFFINYLFSASYFVIVAAHTIRAHGWKFSRGKLHHTGIMLILWFISCFALNREMNVFYDSVNWLCVWIIISSTALLLAIFHESIPGWFKWVVFLFLGSALLLFAYYALYLLPLYVISAMALIAIGISGHTFTPLLLSIVTLIIIVRAIRAERKLLIPVLAGFFIPLIICALYLHKWGATNNKMNLIINHSTLNDTKLPTWVSVSQQIDHSGLVERMLKTGLVYHAANRDGNIFWGEMPTHSFDEPQQHDPFVVLATLLFGKPDIDEGDRIKILKSMYNARQHAQERLWNGDNLETISVISNVKLFPEYRTAYTEKTLTIRNTSVQRWVDRQEAIYTFHLSEGSVVSSLSLWINGQEEKSRLTTKAKADSAYHQIVGVENRDPSVVHWQEGNTITVRVFPCTPEENRKFRIGITSPMKIQGRALIYENPYFEGPQASGALETVQLTCPGNTQGIQVPSGFKQTSVGVYSEDRTYQPGWQISCTAPALAKTPFTFAGASYQVNDYTEQYEAFDAESIYIDLNKAWSRDEFKSVYQQVKNKPVYVFDERIVRLQVDNIDQVYDMMTAKNFSLFPVQEIDHADKALLISKSDDMAPNLNDLDGSEFAKSLTHYFKHNKGIRFYNIGTQLTPYLKALKELRVLNYTEGDAARLQTMLAKHQFVRDQESDSTMVIGTANMMIQKTADTTSHTAPDHLLRLFAYNDVMRKVGANYFNNNYVQPDVINEAESAYIVSPVSSLIVLETKKDYERFNIAENKNSLKNASMKSSGSVPEPKEWALIVLALLVIGYLIYKPKFSFQTA